MLRRHRQVAVSTPGAQAAPPSCHPPVDSEVLLAGQQGMWGGKSHNQSKSFTCPHSKGSAFGKDGARMGSSCPVRASEPQDSSHHPFPTHSAASSPSLLRLAPSIIHAPHCSLCTLGCCHRLSHALAGKLQPSSQPAVSGVGQGSRAVRRSSPASSRHRVQAISPRLSRAAAGGWRERGSGSPGCCPAPFLHTPVIILSITFINTLHSAGFFHTS